MRRAISAAAVALLAIPLAACGGNSDSAGKSGGTITIGLLAPLTGAVAQNAEQQKNMAQMRVEEINKAGGIGGKDLVLKVYDTKLDPAAATQQAQRAISQDHVAGLIGPYASAEALAVADVVERAQVVDINNSAATNAITSGKSYVFRTSPLTSDLTIGMMRTAKALGETRGVLLYDNGGFGLGAKDPMAKAAEAEGVTLTDSIEYPLGAADVSAQVTAAAKSKPGAVFIAGSAGADYGLIAKAMVEQGLNVPLIGFSPIIVPDAVKIAGDAYDKLPGVYTLGTQDTGKPIYQDLLKRYVAAYGDVAVITEQVLQTYDAVNWLAEGFKKTDGKGGEALAKALEEMPAMESAGGRAGTMQQFSADDHDAYGEKYLVLYKVEGGKPTVQSDLNIDG